MGLRKILKIYFPKYVYLLVFLTIALIILNKLLLPGYILTLDMVWPKRLTVDYFFGWRERTWNGEPIKMVVILPLQIFFLLLNQLFPSWIIQKIILILILLLCGIGAYNLCPTKNKFAKLFAGLIYMINPFTYIRFLSGQYGVLFSYSLLPFAVKYMIEFFENRSFKNMIKVAITFTLIPILFGNHYLPVVFAFFFLFLIINIKPKKERKNLIKYSLLTILLFTILSSYWLIPFLTSRQEYAPYEFTEEDVKFFTTKQAIDFNVVFNTAAMYGFWRSVGYILPKNILPFWYLFFVFILFLVVHGFVINKKSKYAKPLVIVAIISLILATGVTHQYFSKLFLLLYNNFPLFRSFREPQKLVGVLVLAYSYFGGLGLADLIKGRKSKKLKYLFILFSLSIPFVYTFPMLYNGFYGQLNSKFYPEIYQQINNYLNQDKTEFNVLYFPWHGYMDYSWSLPQRISNPALKVFDKPIIQGADPIGHPNHPTYNYISFLLNNQKNITNFGELVSLINVKYIIIDKTSLAPLEPYDFLYNQKDLELIIDSDLVVFKNKHSISKIYETDNLLTIEDWDELLKVNISQEKNALNYTKKSPVEYILQEKPTKKYIVFTSTFSEDWKYDNQKSIKYLNLTNVFTATESRRIFYTRSNYYLFGYVISLIVFILLVIIYLRRSPA